MKNAPTTWIHRGVTAACFACALAFPAIAADGLRPFTATYDASYMGMHTTGTMTLAPSGGDRWTYSLRIDRPIARLELVTVFTADGDDWKPLSNTVDWSMLATALPIFRVTTQCFPLGRNDMLPRADRPL
jgi:hypothetical protein